MEILPAEGAWFRPILGHDPYNKKAVDAAEVVLKSRLDYFEKILSTRTFLVGDRLTAADINACAMLDRGFQYIYDPSYRAAYPNITRFWLTIRNQKIYKDVRGEPEFISEKAKYTPPAKEEKPKQAEKPKEVDLMDEDEKPKEKAKHPLESEPPAKMNMDEWKRTYSNEETKDALVWFWKNVDLTGYSLWRVDYKYNEELGLTFQSSNLCGGFFQRLEASRKFLFGCLCVYGVNNDSVISGAFLVRGQDAQKAFDVAPDWESYDYTKLDGSKTEDKEFVEAAWSWDKPLVIKGKSYDFVDGKVFK